MKSRVMGDYHARFCEKLRVKYPLLTRQMNGLSALEYFKKFFREILAGRQGYEIFLPMTIGIR